MKMSKSDEDCISKPVFPQNFGGKRGMWIIHKCALYMADYGK